MLFYRTFEEVDKLKTVLGHCFTKITLLEEKLCMMKDIMDCFTTSNKEINVNIGKIWICLAEELVSDLDVEMIEKFVNFEEFFNWPANFLHLLDEQTSKVRNILFLSYFYNIQGEM